MELNELHNELVGDFIESILHDADIGRNVDKTDLAMCQEVVKLRAENARLKEDLNTLAKATTAGLNADLITTITKLGTENARLKTLLEEAHHVIKTVQGEVVSRLLDENDGDLIKTQTIMGSWLHRHASLVEPATEKLGEGK